MHTLLLVRSIQFMSETMEEDELNKQIMQQLEEDGVGQNNTIHTILAFNATSADNDEDFEKFEGNKIT